MKNCLIILGLFLFVSFLNDASATVFVKETYPTYNSNSYNRAIRRPTYNPYSSPYNYRRYNRNDIKRIERLNKFRQLNRIKNQCYRNFLTWDLNRNRYNYNSFNNGNLTGYSLPINKNVYSQVGIDIEDTTKQTSPINTTNIFSSPTGSETYYSDGRYYINNGGVSGTTGVKIIYD